MRFRIGTRSSALAMAQANLVRDLLRQVGTASEVVPFQTQGDRILDRALDEIPGKGLFTTELEQALSVGEVDCAVHSLKDLPVELTPGLTVGAYLPREDARDALVSPHPVQSLDDLPEGSVLGTSSVRRRAVVRGLRPDLRIVPVRGNLATRIAKMEREGWDGLILAAAGLMRLGWHHRISALLDPSVVVPAPGQGVVAVEIRADDAAVRNIVTRIHDSSTAALAAAERALLAELGGGCQIPLGAYAVWVDARQFRLTAKITATDGQRSTLAAAVGTDPVATAEMVAQRLLASGGQALLDGEQGASDAK